MSPSAQEFFEQKPAMTFIISAHYGAGKTRQGMTFPKVYAIGFDPNGLDILHQKDNEGIAKNLVWYEYINQTSDDELRDIFRQTINKEGKKGRVYQIFEHIKELAEKGEVNTILFDGVTYFADLRWRLFNLDEIIKSERTGNIDVQSMYRSLGISLMTFFSRDLLPLSTRYGLNIVCTCHLKRETEESIQGTDKKAGKVSKLSDIAPMIEGGFRNKVEGLFGASIYLERKLGVDGKPVYLAHCSIKQAFSTVVEAKNRYGLPQTFDVTNKSLYESVMGSIRATTPIMAK